MHASHAGNSGARAQRATVEDYYSEDDGEDEENEDEDDGWVSQPDSDDGEDLDIWEQIEERILQDAAGAGESPQCNHVGKVRLTVI